ncbi:NUDIX hydrolase [Pararhizobium antarcticum]|uniref:Hydrolase n=1 Tax=Pararhizobium antarcticum TaxID=1798805 RepID=A0A657LXU1_9HYPH|nr:NUDIX hydrolase [Pararhizobium antarcticum]OJG00247.1 hydrolase [Pararhizobium antarcticum]OJG00878.1 hydrolase [Rhizobium sp. 58]
MQPETAAPPVSAKAERTLRPRDAASIMLLDRSNADVRVLVGRRHRAHVFMPDVHVFPGGRRDAGDRLIRWNSDINPAVLDRLKAGCGPRATESRLRAIALAALRELHEEASIAIGSVSSANTTLPFLPDLANLRYIARAITPPGYPRRFDTHFFAVFVDEAGIDPMDIRDSRELEDLRWIDVNDVSSVTMPDITGIILDALRENLAQDPSLPFGRPVPFFHTRHGRFIRDVF